MRTSARLFVAAWLLAGCGGGTLSPTPSIVPGSAATPGSTLPIASPSVTQQQPSPTGAGSPGAAAPTASAASPGTFSLISSAFEDGGAIPSRFTCDGKDVSPPLAWSGVPDGTVAFLVTMRDPDAENFLHWIAWNIPAEASDLAAGASGDLPGHAGEGISDFGGNRRGYRGPCPPSGTHDYVITLYALPIALADARTTPPSRLERAASQIALGTATLRGRYRRH